MNIDTLESNLAGLPVPHIRYFDTIGSTNDEALAWIAEGAEEGCLVVADQQTQGRGRFHRRWVTRSGAALAFSLILHPTDKEMSQFGFFSPLGAMAISQALEKQFGLAAQIKWPNDVLLQSRKVAGILVDAAWMSRQMQGLVVGIGVNITPEAVPPADELLFPATSVADAVSQLNAVSQPIAVDREGLLREILEGIFYWRTRLTTPEFFQAWQDRLAFKEEWVRIEEAGNTGAGPLIGKVIGIDPQGNLLLCNAAGEAITVTVGDVHLRLME